MAVRRQPGFLRFLAGEFGDGAAGAPAEGLSGRLGLAKPAAPARSNTS